MARLTAFRNAGRLYGYSVVSKKSATWRFVVRYELW